MDNNDNLKECSNNTDNKLKQLYNDLLKDLGDDCYVQINPVLFAINESIFRDENS